ncbi:A disintegrin and metallopeptidase domain 3-like [Sciurus carolinensis]|uniref:A disintegrin and metallopeptidase domain 3-like n=1 Tax=Sciurus carolinensis TaxID=30640 RepID=UPI001FB1F41B|nr:A disintegrin and metallopeptidase domain 3-like [Sciurus carolinensis]
MAFGERPPCTEVLAPVGFAQCRGDENGTSGATDDRVLQSTVLDPGLDRVATPSNPHAVWLRWNTFDPALQKPSSQRPRDTGVALQPPPLWPVSETSLLQIMVPKKIETSNNYEDITETHASCFYEGYVENIPKSAVTLNICSGLRGFLLLENVSYGIEPLESSATFEHMIYQIKNDKNNYSPLIEGYSGSQYIGQPYRILVKTDTVSEITLKTTLKIQIIIDKAMFDYMDSDMDIAAEKVIQIIGLINTMFSQLKMTVMLSSLEIWSDQNKISTNGSADEILQRFLSWKQTILSPRSTNMAYLLIYKDYPNFVGATYHGKACDSKFAVGIILHPKTISLEAFSVVLAQLIGINVGLTYDDIYNCYCPESTCVMNPGAIRSQGIKVFSRCSTDEFKQTIARPQFGCLQKKKLLPKVVYQPQSTCGNGVMEGGEECDCGQPESCDFKKCCNPTTCTLVGSSECGSGACCNKANCKMFERGHLCRRSRDDCDFPEYCNGTSPSCVPDVKAANLEPCNNGSAYCLSGICRDPSRHCMELFGRYATNAPYLCVEEINFQNDKFGNCGRVCSFGSVLCGKLACSWGHTSLAPLRDYDLQYTYLAGHVCLSAHLRNTSRKDDTFAQNVAPCGQERVCNSNLNCHCDRGYAPPDCEEVMSSPGGSFDDGFWLRADQAKLLLLNQQKAVRPKSGLLISFYVFLPFLIITAIIVLKWNKMKKFLHREETISGGYCCCYSELAMDMLTVPIARQDSRTSTSAIAQDSSALSMFYAGQSFGGPHSDFHCVSIS